MTFSRVGVCIYVAVGMKIFYTSSRSGKGEYQDNYNLILKTIESFKVELVSTEGGNYIEMLSLEARKRFKSVEELRKDWFWHYQAIRNGIHWSEAFIVEISNEDFQLGHEVTLALMEKKPVLCLSANEDWQKKIHHDYFFAAKYSQKTIQGIIQDFLVKVRSLTLSRRFNLFLYPHQVDYLEKAARKYGTNMSDYIRRLINLDRRSHAAVGEGLEEKS